MFFESKQKKFEREREAYQLALRERRFGEARAHAEAAHALARELGAPMLQVEAAEAIAVASIDLTDWARAEAIWTETATALRQSPGPASPATLQAHVRLVETMAFRERFHEAVEVVRSYASNSHGDDLAVATDAPVLLAKAGRREEAFELAKRLFNRETDSRNAARAMRSARCLAEVLLRSDQGRSGIDTAINLMVDCVQRVPVNDEVSLLLRLRCEAVLCEGLIKRGDLNEAAAATRATLANLVRLPPPRLRATVVALLRMQALQADALAALGQLEEAFLLYRAAVRKVETDLKSPRDPALIALLEGLARVLRAKGDEKEAEVQERRARAIRLQVTGKSESSIRLDEPEPKQPWPRRTLAGIYALRGVNFEVLQHLAQQTWTAYKGPQLAGLDVVRPDETGQAFLLLRPHDKPWDPAMAVASKQVLRSLAGAVETVNAGIALSAGGAQARGAPRIGVAPWYAVSEFLACEWWTWPVEERERIKREVFPALPGWVGAVDQHFEWLGRGVIQEGTVYLVTPNLRMTFVPRRGIELTALGPPELIDAWFFDLALATRWFTASSYEPLAPQPVAAPVAQA